MLGKHLKFSFRGRNRSETRQYIEVVNPEAYFSVQFCFHFKCWQVLLRNKRTELFTSRIRFQSSFIYSRRFKSLSPSRIIFNKTTFILEAGFSLKVEITDH